MDRPAYRIMKSVIGGYYVEQWKLHKKCLIFPDHYRWEVISNEYHKTYEEAKKFIELVDASRLNQLEAERQVPVEVGYGSVADDGLFHTYRDSRD